MSKNLPDNTTNAQIDKHYGGTDVVVFGDVKVAVSAETLAENDIDTKKDALKRQLEKDNWDDIVEIKILEEERL